MFSRKKQNLYGTRDIVAKKTKLAINLSVLLRVVHHTHHARSRQGPTKDVMGFLEGVVHERKDCREVEVLNCHPAVEEEFMEKPFAGEVFMKGKELCSSLDKKQMKRGRGGKGDSEPSHHQIVGWYHTHLRESTSMTVMDKINHLSLLDIMVSDESGQLQGTLENMFEGKRDAGAGKSEGGGIIHDAGIALIFSPSLFMKHAPFNRYLKFYAFDNTEHGNSVLLSSFKELKTCNIRTDLETSLRFMGELAETMSGVPPEASLPHQPPEGKRSRAAAGVSASKKKGGAGRGMKVGKEKPSRKKLDRECLDKYTKKEESIRKRIEKIKKMISNREDVSTITTQLKKTKLYLDKLSKMLQRDMKTLPESREAEDTILGTDCTILMRKLREHNTELDRLISEMYYKVLTDLSDEGITL